MAQKVCCEKLPYLQHLRTTPVHIENNVTVYTREELLYFMECIHDNGSEAMLKLWNSHKSFFGEMHEVDVIALMCKSAVDAGDALYDDFASFLPVTDSDTRGPSSNYFIFYYLRDTNKQAVLRKEKCLSITRFSKCVSLWVSC
ncbi:uncharacterized protein LOC121046828 [Ixodes scapularis]|uniref:uncharacterized protein LOC121046828 n=1 Tax=Ixodes scapularis TaxID=6945 RepID=UPI001C395361|nr:uncharacterized protein LOC121046828 [Ixodes scapularis]